MDSELLEETWAKMLPGLNRIFQNNVGREDRLKLYSHIVRYCTRPHDKNLANPENLRMNTVGIRGWLLYLKVKDFLTSVCNGLGEKCAELEGEDLLRYYNTEWKKFRSAKDILNAVFVYMNKYYIANHVDFDEDPEVEVCYKIGVLAIVTWKETLFEKYNGKILKAANAVLNWERQGEFIDCSLIRDLVKCCSDLGISADGKTASMSVYKNYLEKSVLEETENFYVMESTAFLESESEFVDYLKLVERRFREEKLMVFRYLDSSTEELLIEILQSSLIARHIKYFCGSFEKMLTSEDYDSIRCLHSFVSNYEEYLSEFTSIFQKHVRSQGLSAIEGCSAAAVKNPKMYVDAILMVYQKYMNFTDRILSGDSAYKYAIEKATVGFVNKNYLTMEPNTSRKTSELVTKYCDQLLRSTNPNQQEKLDEIMTVFQFIEDKDVFQDYYFKLLSRRLVNNMSNDEELESYLILKMKDICGIQFVAKFERMLRDIQLSQDINATFSRNNQESLDVDFNIMVLKCSAWSFPSSPNHNLPLELEKCVAAFNNFYSKEYSGKKLIWMYNLSQGEIFTNNFKSRYTIQASTRQISILLLFNISDSWTVGQIKEETNIDLDIVLQIIQILLKVHLVNCKSAQNLTADSTVCLNKSYNNKKHRININIPLKTETRTEQEATDKNIDQERIFIIQAIIVKIMKSKKTVNHLELVSNVLEELASKFKPDIEFIKKNIEVLVEKEYIKRSLAESNTYEYIA